MSPDHFRYVRQLYGETQVQFGRRLGFTGSDGPRGAIARRVRRYEGGSIPIVGTLAALLTILLEQKTARRRGKKRSFIAARVSKGKAS